MIDLKRSLEKKYVLLHLKYLDLDKRMKLRKSMII